MQIGVIGYKGRLGTELINRGCVPLKCDILKAREVFDAIKATNPDLIINTAAITNVDKCQEVGTYKKAVAINKLGMMNLTEIFDRRKTIIHISTDYVFEGKRGPYSENADTQPISQYGLSKLFSEQILLGSPRGNCTVVRTTILYGGKKTDFVRKVLSQLKRGKPFKIPMNLYGTPTYVPHLAEALIKLANMETMPNIVHIAGEDWLSRYEFATMIASVFGYDKELILPVKYKWDGKSASRPLKAGLKTTLAKKLGLPIYTVLSGLERMKGEN